jgi:hypothetical protein
MNEFDTRVFDELEAFTPEPTRQPSWDDILVRARRARTRRIVVGLAAALTAFGSVAAVAAALGGFDRWLSGEPGKPAPKSEQRRFEEANSRSLAAFPKDTRLRELIQTEVDGKRYVLYGFRSGGSVCLRLKAVSLGHSIAPKCAPVSSLMRAPAPIVPIVGNYGFSDRHNHPSATVSYGIAADGVSRVEVHAVDATHRAALSGNAYLWVEDRPNTGQHVRTITSFQTSGSRITLPIATADGMFVGLDSAPERPARGPTRIEAKIRRPTVGWFVRGERRGVTPAEIERIAGTKGNQLNDLGGTQFVKPDPQSNALVGLTGRWCLLLMHNGTGTACSAGREFWSRGPLNVMLSMESDEFMRVAGVAADGVTRVVVFLSDGQRQPAALRDNLFTTLVAKAEFPVRVVAYDGRGRVVGVLTWPWMLGGKVPAKATRPLHPVLRVVGPNGTTAVARVGRPVRGFQCWRVDFSTGRSAGACMPPFRGPSIWVNVVQPTGRDVFVLGQTRWPIARVRVEFADGTVISTRPRSGHFVVAIPRAQLKPRQQVAHVVGYTTEDLRYQRRGFVYKVLP